MKSFTIAVMAAATAQAFGVISPQAAGFAQMVADSDANDNSFLVMKSLLNGPAAPKYNAKAPLSSLFKQPEAPQSNYQVPALPKMPDHRYTSKEIFKEVTNGKQMEFKMPTYYFDK